MEDPGIYSMRADGSRVHRILEDGWGAAWSPDGTRVAYSATGPRRTNLYLMSAEGTHVRRLTRGVGRHSCYDPAWSPDGTRIAFTSHGRGIRSHIWIVTIATHDIVRFTRGISADFAPDWSPDGSMIAFTSDRAYAPDSSGNDDIWLKDVESGERTRVTRALAVDDDASWSPDGSTIAFTSARGGGRRRIWVRELDGGLRLLTRAGRGDEFDPDWSPDGKRIAFVRQYHRLTSNIWVMNVQTGHTRKLTSSDHRFFGDPCWRALEQARTRRLS
jgi:TolB protein